MELRTDDGDVLLRMRGRVDQVCGLPPHIWRYRTKPRACVFSRELRGAFDDVPGSGHCTLRELDAFGGPFLVEMEGIWALLLSRYVLNDVERKTFAQLRLPPTALASWLLGRVVCKDAVRAHMSLDACMADVGIDSDELGKPSAVPPGGEPPLVSFSHVGYDAVAIAADAHAFGGVGIDLEPIRRVDPCVVAEAFTSEERHLIEATADDRGEGSDMWTLSAWGAKEAVGKALGCGLVGGPRNVEIVAIDGETGRLSARLGGALAEAAARDARSAGTDPRAATRGLVRVDAYRRVVDKRVIVVCLLEPR